MPSRVTFEFSCTEGEEQWLHRLIRSLDFAQDDDVIREPPCGLCDCCTSSTVARIESLEQFKRLVHGVEGNLTADRTQSGSVDYRAHWQDDHDDHFHDHHEQVHSPSTAATPSFLDDFLTAPSSAASSTRRPDQHVPLADVKVDRFSACEKCRGPSEAVEFKEQHAAAVVTQLAHMYQDGNRTDLAVVVGERRFEVHGCVLMCGSEFFRTQLEVSRCMLCLVSCMAHAPRQVPCCMLNGRPAAARSIITT